MNNGYSPDAIIERMRINLRTAGIAYREADIAAVVESGMLDRVQAFEALLAAQPPVELPEYLHRPNYVKKPATEPSSTPDAQPPAPSDSLIAVAEQLRTRAVSPVELTEQALAAIAARDPELNMFQFVLAEYARTQARRAEQEIMAGTYRGPLHGVPIAAKDLLAMCGTPTTAGSKILADWVPDFDAAAVERLVAAGAVIVGKTRLSEYAYWPGSANPHYGPTKNPWNLAHDTGGSSSGSAAAVAAGIVYGALGSDTGGSIRIPAAQCGLVGLKPTFGRTSLYGAIPLSWSLDHLGPLTRTVADTAAMLDVLAGYDARDIRTQAPPPDDYGAAVARARSQGRLDGLRIGVLRDSGTGEPLATPAALAAWQAGLQALERAGATLHPLDLPELEALRPVHGALLALEAIAYHQPMLQQRLTDFGPIVRPRLLYAYAYSPPTMIQAQQLRAHLRQRLDAIFEHVDVLSTPPLPDAAPALGEAASTVFAAPFNVLGWPTITVPVGWTTARLPLGLQLAGRPWDEVTLLRAAAVLELELPTSERPTV